MHEPAAGGLAWYISLGFLALLALGTVALNVNQQYAVTCSSSCQLGAPLAFPGGTWAALGLLPPLAALGIVRVASTRTREDAPGVSN